MFDQDGNFYLISLSTGIPVIQQTGNGNTQTYQVEVVIMI